MRRHWIVFIAVSAVLGSLPAEASDCSVLPRPHMRVRLTVPPGLPSGATATIRRIVDHTWGPEGLAFEWTEGTAGTDAWDGVDVWVAAVHGLNAAGKRAVLGEVVFRGNTPSRMVRISIDAAIAWVRRDRAERFASSAQVLEQMLGDTHVVSLALGHAAAHEVGHFVLGSAAHSRSGVMRASFERARSVLSNPQTLRLDEASRARLAARLADADTCTPQASRATAPR